MVDSTVQPVEALTRPPVVAVLCLAGIKPQVIGIYRLRFRITNPKNYPVKASWIRMQNDRNDFEVRYRIRPEKGRWENTPQYVEFQRILSSIATNDPEADIRLLKPDRAFLVQ